MFHRQRSPTPESEAGEGLELQQSRPLRLSHGTNQGCLLSHGTALRAARCGLRHPQHPLYTWTLGGAPSGPHAEIQPSEQACSCISLTSHPRIPWEWIHLLGEEWLSKDRPQSLGAPQRGLRALQGSRGKLNVQGSAHHCHHPYFNLSGLPLPRVAC